jgi:hypothetical protein
MTNEKLAVGLSEWMKDTEFAPPDSQRSAREVATRLPQTRQVGRRWWLPTFQRSATVPPTTDQTADYQPTSIPATNGRTPNVIGRTQSMFSPAKAITAGALVFALGGVLLIAQPFDQQGASVPGAATDAEHEPPTEFTGTAVGGLCSDESTTEVVDGISYSGDHCNPIWEMSDPRLNGTVTWSSSVAEDGLVGFGYAANSIENAGGKWRGRPVPSFDIPGAAGQNVKYIILDGEGDYEGLVAVLVDEYIESEDQWRMQGFIVDGEFPPPPENASTR